jgi:ABC-2 type transport system ATP-binding protein
MAVAAVRTERLTKDFVSGFWRATTHRALDDLSFEVPAGGIFGLLGPNGAGKSTTLKLLLNLLFPSSGRCEVLGRPPNDVDNRRRIGFLPENPAFDRHLTGEEFVACCGRLFGMRGPDLGRRVGALLDRVGLGADKRRPVRTYSKGMLQRLGLAQALVNDPDLVILDEPAAGLDPIGRRDLCALLTEVSHQGKTVIFSSHILSDVERLCSHVAILRRGRLAASGPLHELLSGRTLEDAFFEIVGEAGEEARGR